jgi:hypothetical protein
VTAIPSGAALKLVTNVKESGKVKGRAELGLRFTRLQTGPVTYDIDTRPLYYIAESTKKDDAVKIGVGAAAGAVIGAIAGGGKGAIGSAIGAGGARAWCSRPRRRNPACGRPPAQGLAYQPANNPHEIATHTRRGLQGSGPLPSTATRACNKSLAQDGLFGICSRCVFSTATYARRRAREADAALQRPHIISATRRSRSSSAPCSTGRSRSAAARRRGYAVASRLRGALGA